MRRSRWTPRPSDARPSTGRSARGFARVGAAGAGDARRGAFGRPRSARTHGSASGIRNGAGTAAGADGQTAVRTFAVQRAPALFRYITSSPAPIGILGDLLASAVNPNVGVLHPVAGRDGNRSADGAMDRGADRLPGGLRRASGQRRQHGQFRLFPRRASGKGGLECARARSRRRRRSQAPSVRVGRDTYLDPEGGGPERTGVSAT